MSEETENLFKAIFELEEIREILRQTAPNHKLSDEQKKKLKASIETIKESIKKLEGLL